MVGLCKDPKGEQIFSKASSVENSLAATTTRMKSNDTELTTLKRKIKELESELEASKVYDILGFLLS